MYSIFDPKREDCTKYKLDYLESIDLFEGWELMHLLRVVSVLKTIMYI